MTIFHLFYLVILCTQITVNFSYGIRFLTRAKIVLNSNVNVFNSNKNQNFREATFEDMKTMAVILSNITDYIDSEPGTAMKVVSDHMGWLYSRNVPKLTQMLLTDYPELREDTVMMRSYMFLMDFLEAVTKETKELLNRNHALLKMILEAAKNSESKLSEVISANSASLISPEFMLYLDTEIENQEVNSHLQSLLVTIKLRLMDEWGKTKGIDVMLLPKIASEDDPNVMRQKTIEVIRDYSTEGRELFLMTLQLMRKEITKRYDQVDPVLLKNLEEIEKITKLYINTNK